MIHKILSHGGSNQPAYNAYRFLHGCETSLKLGWIAGCLGAIFLFLVLPCADSFAEIDPPLVWNTGDMITGESGLSVFRYSAIGLGEYLFRDAAPGASVRVYLNGVPEHSFSPFGPDLELIPASIADSLVVDPGGGVHIMLPDPIGKEPVTSIHFGQGVRRRVNFDVSFIRSLSDSSGILFNGASSGIHTGDENLKASLRSYYFMYSRLLQRGGRASFSARGFRDRDALADLDRQLLMGERKTDTMTFSTSVESVPVVDGIVADGTVYYSAVNSRFGRYGDRKSLDHNGYGFSLALTTVRGNTSYGVCLSDDASMFDSRIHDDSWTRHETRAFGTFSWNDETTSLRLEGGVLNNSEYGGGIKITADASRKLHDTVRAYIRGQAGTEYPDIGSEYYTSLAFSDTMIVADLDRAFLSSWETGLATEYKGYTLRLAGFFSRGKRPIFLPSSNVLDIRVMAPFPTHSYMSKKETIYGLRYGISKRIETWSVFDIDISGCNRMETDDTSDIFPYPDYSLTAGIEMNDTVYKDRIALRAYSHANMMHWQDGLTTPDGLYDLVDCGLSIGIGTLELFYRIENITNENIPWYNTFGWLGRNGLWGASWRFMN